MAQVIGINIGYILLTFLPPILWLLFYLREDRRFPEPKKLLIIAFVGGMVAAIFAVVGECLFIQFFGDTCAGGAHITLNPIILFIGIALIEEYLKYAPIKFFIINRPAFDEPIDAMIYLMTSAMGFAALENTLFLVPIFQNSASLGFEVITNRFLGANLLHALSSGIVGFFLAQMFLHRHRHLFIGLGILLASLLHASFNYFILISEDVPQGILYVVLLLAVMAIMVFIDFRKLKKLNVNFVKQ